MVNETLDVIARRFHCGVVYKRVHLHAFETLGKALVVVTSLQITVDEKWRVRTKTFTGSKEWKRYWCAFRRGVMLFYRFPKNG